MGINKPNVYRARQLDHMRAAGAMARDILLELADMVKPGVTTGEIDAHGAELMEEKGCESAFLGYRGFPGNICISTNEEVVHGIGDSRVIQYGDILKIDVKIHLNGWIGGNALTVPVGAVSPEVDRLLFVTEESLHVAIDHARDGVLLGDLCASIEECVVKNGFTVVRNYVGHGVGRRLHEEPQVPNYRPESNKPRLRAGNILAIEPMVNMGTAETQTLDDDWTVVTRDRKPSAHFEHTVLITEGEPEVLTWRERRTTA